MRVLGELGDLGCRDSGIWPGKTPAAGRYSTQVNTTVPKVLGGTDGIGQLGTTNAPHYGKDRYLYFPSYNQASFRASATRRLPSAGGASAGRCIVHLPNPAAHACPPSRRVGRRVLLTATTIISTAAFPPPGPEDEMRFKTSLKNIRTFSSETHVVPMPPRALAAGADAALQSSWPPCRRSRRLRGCASTTTMCALP